MTVANLEKAMRVASPRLAAEVEQGKHLFAPGTVERLEYDSAAGAARTMVYRILAALNGFDVVNHVAPRDNVSAPVIIPQEIFGRLRQAVMNETVFAAMINVVGEDEANTLLGELAAL